MALRLHSMTLLLSFLLVSRTHSGQVELLQHTAPAGGKEYGGSLAHEGDWVFVGAPGADGAGARPEMGEVHVWRDSPQGWKRSQVLTSSAPSDHDRLGTSVSVSGSWLAAGTLKGRVQLYHFDGTSWVEDVELRSPAGASARLFGVFLQLDGERLAVGDQWEAGVGEKSGAAYVYHRTDTGWHLEQRLVPEHPAAEDWFGYPALSGTTLLLGAPGKGGTSGAFYVFQRDATGWHQRVEVRPAELEPGDLFGGRIDFDGATALVAATSAGAGSVRAYAQVGTSWQTLGALVPADLTGTEQFGSGLDVKGDLAVVGSRGGFRTGSVGRAYLFRRRGLAFEPAGEFVPEDNGTLQFFGTDCELVDRRVLVGDTGSHHAGGGTGSVHEFRLLGEEVELVQGSGLNPDVLGSDDAQLGVSFEATLGLQAPHSSSLALLVVSSGIAPGRLVLGGRGEWLLGGSARARLGPVPHLGTGTTVRFSAPVPNDPLLLGTRWAAQAIVAGGAIRLTNALTGIVR